MARGGRPTNHPAVLLYEQASLAWISYPWDLIRLLPTVMIFRRAQLLGLSIGGLLALLSEHYS
jgi:hypothetical protein